LKLTVLPQAEAKGITRKNVSFSLPLLEAVISIFIFRIFC